MSGRRTKVIAVAYPMGRVGSSATMGLLRLTGADVGDPSRRVGKSAMNPKGFLELKSQNIFLQVAYPGIYPDVVAPPEIADLRRIGARHADAYRRFLDMEFEDAPIAVKSPRLLTLPFLNELQSDFDTHIIFLERDLTDQASSIHRVWSNSGDSFKQSATPEFIRNWVSAWMEMSRELLTELDFEPLSLSFEEVVQEPTTTMDRISSFANLPRPSDHKVKQWIDPSLVDRSQLQLRTSKNLKDRTRRFLHRAVDRLLGPTR